MDFARSCVNLDVLSGSNGHGESGGGASTVMGKVIFKQDLFNN